MKIALTLEITSPHGYSDLYSTSDAEYSAHAILDSPEISKNKNVHETGRHGSKININRFKPHQFFGADLMVTSISAKTLIFDQF